MDAANVDLKAFTEEFYFKFTGAHLPPVLDTLSYLVRETACWTEITTLLIPGNNDTDDELGAACGVDRTRTWAGGAAALQRVPSRLQAPRRRGDARVDADARPPNRPRGRTSPHVYTGNVHDTEGGTTYCAACDAPLIVRDWHRILRYDVTDDLGRAARTARARSPGASSTAGGLRSRRVPVRLALA